MSKRLRNGRDPREIKDEGGMVLATVSGPLTCADVLTDARRLVHRWNCHGELVQALQSLLADTQHAEHSCDDDGCPVQQARAAIAKATSTEAPKA